MQASIDAETKTEQDLLEQEDSLFESVDMEDFDIDAIKEEIGGNASFASLLTDESDSDEGEVVDESLLVSNCGLMPETVASLEAKGIKALFPIQKMVFEPIKEGRDVVARAKTGSGKTLAFALPVVEKIIDSFGGERKPHGRSPQCLVLAPTRELAKQVEREFASVAASLDVGCFYGGAPIFSQKKMLQRGVDVVVGTPGRLIDLIDQNSLDLSEVCRLTFCMFVLQQRLVERLQIECSGMENLYLWVIRVILKCADQIRHFGRGGSNVECWL